MAVTSFWSLLSSLRLLLTIVRRHPIPAVLYAVALSVLVLGRAPVVLDMYVCVVLFQSHVFVALPESLLLLRPVCVVLIRRSATLAGHHVHLTASIALPNSTMLSLPLTSC